MTFATGLPSGLSTRDVPHRLARLAGWRCHEPIVVFESDDWGMARRRAGGVQRRAAK